MAANRTFRAKREKKTERTKKKVTRTSAQKGLHKPDRQITRGTKKKTKPHQTPKNQNKKKKERWIIDALKRKGTATKRGAKEGKERDCATNNENTHSARRDEKERERIGKVPKCSIGRLRTRGGTRGTQPPRKTPVKEPEGLRRRGRQGGMQMRKP